MENLETVSSNCASRQDEFIELLTSHKHQIFNYIFCVLHSLADAEDVFQQTSIALWQNFAQFESNTDFRRVGFQGCPPSHLELSSLEAARAAVFLG